MYKWLIVSEYTDRPNHDSSLKRKNAFAGYYRENESKSGCLSEKNMHKYSFIMCITCVLKTEICFFFSTKILICCFALIIYCKWSAIVRYEESLSLNPLKNGLPLAVHLHRTRKLVSRYFFVKKEGAFYPIIIHTPFFYASQFKWYTHTLF